MKTKPPSHKKREPEKMPPVRHGTAPKPQQKRLRSAKSLGLQNDTLSRPDVRRMKVAELMLQGKTEQQIADALGCHRVHVARIKVDARTQQRIRYLLEQEGVSEDEVKATLASHMRADITDLYDDTGSLQLATIRKRNLGHLIKKLKQTRRYEGKGKEREPVDEIELELNGQQSAAIQLSKILGIEKQGELTIVTDSAESRRDWAEKQLATWMAKHKQTREQAIASLRKAGAAKMLEYLGE